MPKRKCVGSVAVLLVALVLIPDRCPAQTVPATMSATAPATRHYLNQDERDAQSMNRTWQESAQQLKLLPQEVEQLQRDKLVIGQRRFRQVFSPYVGSGVPHFITSDSLLNGFHVLFEESFRRLETVQARRLVVILKKLWQGLEKMDPAKAQKQELFRAALRRDLIIIGTALRLVGDNSIKPDEEISRLIDQQVKVITEASATTKPVFLGPPDARFLAIDYSRCKPRGFYTGSELLQRHFRAVAWLQAIPFRVDRDEEFLAMEILANAYGFLGNDSDDGRFFKAYERPLGAADDCDLGSAINFLSLLEFPKDARMEERRAAIKSVWGNRTCLNDQISLIPDDPSQVAELSLRILPSYCLPDTLLLSRTTERRQFDRPLPSGLDVAVALGLPAARAALTGPQREKLLATIDANQPLMQAGAGTIYSRYLDCLRTLVASPEKDVPLLFSSPAWQTKTCQTILGSWAQMRHTFVLQSKPSVYFFASALNVSGFVEPVPEFYGALAALAKDARSALESVDAFKPDFLGAAEQIRKLADLVDRVHAIEKGESELWKLPDSELKPFAQILGINDLGKGSTEEGFISMLTGDLPKLRGWADELEHGRVPDAILAQRALEVEPYSTEPDLKKLWDELIDMSREMQSMAHKQLRGVPFDNRERGFILSYGERLAAVMLYGGEAYEQPLDDAPRVVDIASDPERHQVLEVGVGRPRVLYILYPWQGREILCRGAVMPYYEFANKQRLNDSEFKAMLDSPNTPALPAWVQPIYAQQAGAASKPAP